LFVYQENIMAVPPQQAAAEVAAAVPQEEEEEGEEEDEEEQPMLGLDGVNHVLDICGFTTPQQRQSIITEGSFEDVRDFGKMQTKNFYNIANRISKLRANQGGFRIGEIRIRHLEALGYWVRDHKRRNEDIVAQDFRPLFPMQLTQESNPLSLSLIRPSG
jgi:hypothetical protein